MFSASENILLRQHKKRVVQYVESTIPESVLDLGVNVMAMQVTCTTPGCVPIETAIIIIFPQLSDNNNDSEVKELLPGLPESSSGGSYKTKILKPLADVTKEDVLDALPPSFIGGTRTIEKICFHIRDQMFGQITQLFDETDSNNNNNSHITARQLVAQYLHECLQIYIDNGCIPPEIGQPYPSSSTVALDQTTSDLSNTTITNMNDNENTSTTTNIDATNTELSTPVTTTPTFPSTGNITIPRPINDDKDIITTEQSRSSSSSSQINQSTSMSSSSYTSNKISLVNSTTKQRQQMKAVRTLQHNSGNTTANQLLVQLSKHAPGIRRVGCPCCDPDNTSNIVDQYLSQT